MCLSTSPLWVFLDIYQTVRVLFQNLLNFNYVTTRLPPPPKLKHTLPSGYCKHVSVFYSELIAFKILIDNTFFGYVHLIFFSFIWNRLFA